VLITTKSSRLISGLTALRLICARNNVSNLRVFASLYKRLTLVLHKTSDLPCRYTDERLEIKHFFLYVEDVRTRVSDI
jgi:hypothetical protein